MFQNIENIQVNIVQEIVKIMDNISQLQKHVNAVKKNLKYLILECIKNFVVGNVKILQTLLLLIEDVKLED